MAQIKLFTLLLISFVPVLLSAQASDFIPQTSLGLTVAGSASRLYASPSIDQDLLYGYGGGIVFKHISERNLGIQLETNLIQKGWKENTPDSIVSYSRQINYAELVVLSHFQIGKKNTKFYLNIGPVPAYMLSESINMENDTTKISYTYQDEPVSYSFDLGLCGEIGAVSRIDAGVLHFGVRFNQSISDLFSRDAGVLSTSLSQVISLRFAYLWEFGKSPKDIKQ